MAAGRRHHLIAVVSAIALLFVFLEYSGQEGNNRVLHGIAKQPKNHQRYACPPNTHVNDGRSKAGNKTLDRIDLTEFATLLHLGKGGGGTIRRDRMERTWLLKIIQCHQSPCNDKVAERTLQQDQRHGFLVNIRDPVDRFVSTFYWPIVMYCDPKGHDPRIHTHEEVIHTVETHCMKLSNNGYLWKRAFDLNYYEFGHDINQFAAALCGGSNNNETLERRARSSIRVNHHARNRLWSWFRFMNNRVPYDPNAIYPIVLDKAVASLASQTDVAVEWLHNLTHFEDDATFARRRDMVRRHDYCRELDDANQSASTQSFAHSSFTPRTIRPTSQTEQCLVNYFREDYAVLPQIRDTLCKSDDCRRGIQSILDRRQPLVLDDY